MIIHEPTLVKVVMMSSLNLSSQQAIAFIFEHQLLTQPVTSPEAVAERLIAIQTQYHLSLPGAIWSRTNGVSAEDVDNALLYDRSLVKTWSVRHTLHTHRSADLPLLMQAVNQENYQTFVRHLERASQLKDEHLLHELIMDMLEEAPATRQEMYAKNPQIKELSSGGWGRDVRGLAYLGKLVFAEGKQFARREDWLPNLKWELPTIEDAQLELFRRYLSGYGIATVHDFAFWAGKKITDCRQLLDGLEDEIIWATVDGWDGEFVILAEYEDAIQQAEVIPDCLLLTKFDVLTLCFRDKTRFLDEADYKKVYRPAAQVEACVFFKGRTAGTWRQKIKKNSFVVTVEPHRKFTKKEHKQLHQQVESLGLFYGMSDVEIEMADR